MPKKINHDQRKQEILRAALELFASCGYEATTLVDIAKAAHIARPTLYQYFRNKPQILFFASKQFTDDFIVYYKQIVQMRQYAAKYRLRFILSHIVLSCQEKRRELVSQSAFILKLEEEGRSISELVHKRTRPLKTLLAELMAEAEREQQLYYYDLPEVADLLLSLVTSGIVHVLLFPNEGCTAILQHITSLMSLLQYPSVQEIGDIDRQTRQESEEQAYREVDRELIQFISEKERGQMGLDNENSAKDQNLEWQDFLDPFRG